MPAWLKPYATAFASFAKDDGSRVYPSIRRIARMVGRSERAAATAAAELRRRHILELAAPAGRERAARYVFNASALPGETGQYPFTFEKTSFPQAQATKRSGKPAKTGDFHSLHSN